jgi:hypothetical protein
MLLLGMLKQACPWRSAHTTSLNIDLDTQFDLILELHDVWNHTAKDYQNAYDNPTSAPDSANHSSSLYAVQTLMHIVSATLQMNCAKVAPRVQLEDL